jgi:hypothetical protein
MSEGVGNKADADPLPSEPAIRPDGPRQLNIRLSEQVYRIERLIAQRHNMSLAQYVAELVRKDSEQNREVAAQAAREAAEEFAREADLLERPAQGEGSMIRNKKRPG